MFWRVADFQKAWEQEKASTPKETTVVAGAMLGDEAVVMSAGDSRAYVIPFEGTSRIVTETGKLRLGSGEALVMLRWEMVGRRPTGGHRALALSLSPRLPVSDSGDCGPREPSRRGVNHDEGTRTCLSRSGAPGI